MNTSLLLKRLLPFAKPYRWRFALALLCMGAVGALTAIPYYLIKPMLDRGFISKDVATLQHICMVLPLLFIGKGVFAYLQNYTTVKLGVEIVGDIRAKVYSHIQFLSIDFFNAQATAKTLARLTNDAATLQQVFAKVPLYLIRDSLTAIFLLTILFTRSWKFTLFSLSIFPVFVILITFISRALRRLGRKGQEQMGELYALIQENLQSASVIRAYNGESQERERFAKTNNRFIDLSLRFWRTDLITSPLMEMFGSLIAALLLWKGGMDVINGVWTTGDFMSFLGAAFATYKPLKNFADINSQIQLGTVAAQRLFEVLDTPPRISSRLSAPSFAALKNAIEYQGVTFEYPKHDESETRTVLDRVDLTIRKGEFLALVGPSGAGKTTLAMLLPRFYDPTGGRILWDGQDLRDGDLVSLRNQVALVTQDVILFNESVAYNIAYGKPGASKDEILTAAKQAKAHDFIEALPKGYETVIGERGVRLSGGQRQRLSIARALLKNPPLLILDEATSALDAENERLVQEAIEHLMADRTAVVIAHRLATVRKANRILVVDEGKIKEEGTHDLLLAQKGLYSRLHQLQLLQ